MCVDPLPLPSAFRRSCRAMGVIVRRRIDRIAAVDEPSGCPRDSNAPRAAGRFAAKPRSRSEPAATDCADRVGGPPCRSPDRITRVRPTRGLGPASVDETAPRAVASSARRGRNRVVGSPGALADAHRAPCRRIPSMRCPSGRSAGGRPAPLFLREAAPLIFPVAVVAPIRSPASSADRAVRVRPSVRRGVPDPGVVPWHASSSGETVRAASLGQSPRTRSRTPPRVIPDTMLSGALCDRLRVPTPTARERLGR